MEIVRHAAEVNGVPMKPFTLVHREQLARSRFSLSSMAPSSSSKLDRLDSKGPEKDLVAQSTLSTTSPSHTSGAQVPVSVPVSEVALALSKARESGRISLRAKSGSCGPAATAAATLLTQAFTMQSVAPSSSYGPSSSGGGDGRTVTMLPWSSDAEKEKGDGEYSREHEKEYNQEDLERRGLMRSSFNKNSDMDSENYFDLVRTDEMRWLTIPLLVVWFTSGFAYYGLILFVARLYSQETVAGESCSFDYSSIFINATAEVTNQSPLCCCESTCQAF